MNHRVFIWGFVSFGAIFMLLAWIVPYHPARTFAGTADIYLVISLGCLCVGGFAALYTFLFSGMKRPEAAERQVLPADVASLLASAAPSDWHAALSRANREIAGHDSSPKDL
jgi:hypothetical protein